MLQPFCRSRSADSQSPSLRWRDQTPTPLTILRLRVSIAREAAFSEHMDAMLCVRARIYARVKESLVNLVCNAGKKGVTEHKRGHATCMLSPNRG
jgi:hypothetical protein